MSELRCRGGYASHARLHRAKVGMRCHVQTGAATAWALLFNRCRFSLALEHPPPRALLMHFHLQTLLDQFQKAFVDRIAYQIARRRLVTLTQGSGATPVRRSLMVDSARVATVSVQIVSCPLYHLGASLSKHWQSAISPPILQPLM